MDIYTKKCRTPAQVGGAILTATFVGCLAMAAPASADPISGQVGVASEYTGKGLGKSDEDPAFFGSMRWETNGFYASGFFSQATSSKGADAEVIAAVGYQRDIGDWGVDVQAMHRQMAHETNGVDSAYVEVQADVSRDLTDQLGARIRVNYSPDTYGAGDAAWWSEAQATVKLTPRDKLSAAYGLRRIESGVDYDAWNVGVKHKFSPAISGDLRWYDTDGHDLGSRYESRLVASLSYSF
ncbi:TorF family putative porin [Brevundimonas sp.]|uniref:TorF family putative porin n=1 Tax=Brevundimonas sp. TaxID=1871086 RepID=UPI002BF06C36|nr:TorF family putative porin [Brevundimonas sp.]HWQ86613.1 TorF family putative porin [Brevundimonas sp.]